MDPDPSSAVRAAAMAELAARRSREEARQLAVILLRTARALEQSAKLAERHAERRTEMGEHSAAEQERATARRAREASERAARRAKRCQEFSEGSDPPAGSSG